MTTAKRRSLPTRGAWIEITGAESGRTVIASLPTRGAWIEISTQCRREESRHSRSPHGERGLKFVVPVNHRRFLASLPTRGAWIEISMSKRSRGLSPSLPTRGAWIEILYHIGAYNVDTGRSPHGERGLKFRPSLILNILVCRSPHGERGLKLLLTGVPVIPRRRSPHGERGLKS